jgi:hypothetical protein
MERSFLIFHPRGGGGRTVLKRSFSALMGVVRGGAGGCAGSEYLGGWWTGTFSQSLLYLF